MSRKIVGVTVGTPTSPSRIAESIKPISYGQQDLTEEQKAHARDNIGAVSGADVVKTTAQVLTHQQMYTARYNIDAAGTGQVVRVDQAQNLSEEQKAQARENIGVTPGGDINVDLTGYVKDTDYATTDKAGVVKAGMGLSMLNGAIQVEYAKENQIEGKSSYRNPITPVNLDLAVKTGITTNQLPLTAEEQQAAKNWLGVVDGGGGGSADIPSALPNPHKLTFTGAVNAEYDGSEAVEVEIPAGGGGGEWESYKTITLDEEVTVWTIGGALVNDQETDEFASKKYKEVLVHIAHKAPTSGASTSLLISVNNNAGGQQGKINNVLNSSGSSSVCLHIVRVGESWTKISAGQTGSYAEKSGIVFCPTRSGEGYEYFRKSHINLIRINQAVGAGSVFTIWGRR